MTDDRDNDMLGPTPYERDIAAQAAALQDFIDARRPRRIASRSVGEYERVIVTGLGSSHYAAFRTWRRLVAAGIPAWWVDTAALLESLTLVTSSSLLIVSSQSGASGETVAVLEALGETGVTPEIIGVTNDMSSPLALGASAVVDLHSGPEATVSSKSYTNTLAAHEYLATVLLDGNFTRLTGALADTMAALGTRLRVDPRTVAVACAPEARVALIGGGDQGATALFGGLILKEAAKVPAEGFIAGNFRHGPLEVAGPGLVALVFGLHGGADGEPLRRLSADIAATGASVVTFGSASVDGGSRVVSEFYEGLPGLVAAAGLCHQLCVDVARGRGVVPGEFRFGQKVTGL